MDVVILVIYGDKKGWKEAFERNQNDAVKSNIVNGCYLCNNQYYNLCNKALYQRSLLMEWIFLLVI